MRFIKEKTKAAVLSIAVLCLMVSAANCAPLTTDEFNGSAVDTTVWDVILGTAPAGNVSVSGGELTIDLVDAEPNCPGIILKDIGAYDYFKFRMKVIEGTSYPVMMENGNAGSVAGYTHMTAAGGGAAKRLAGVELEPEHWAYYNLSDGMIIGNDYHVYELDARDPCAVKVMVDGINRTDGGSYDWSSGGGEWKGIVFGAIDGATWNGFDSEIVIDYVTTNPNYIPGLDDCNDVREMGFGMAGDLDGNCSADLKDFAMIADTWQRNNNPDNPSSEMPSQRAVFFAPSQQRIAQSKDALDLQAPGRYQTVVTTPGGGVHIARQTWTVDFDSGGNLTDVEILGNAFSNVELGKVKLLTTTSGTIYPTFDGTVNVNDAKLWLTLETNKEITIGSETGTLTLQYKLDKLSGMIRAELLVPANLRDQLSEVTLLNNLGTASSGFEDLFIDYPQFGAGSQAYWVARKANTFFSANGQYGYATWSDGQVGYGVTPFGYEYGADVSVYTGGGGERSIDITYDVATATEFAMGLHFLPPRKFEPMPEQFTAVCAMPVFDSAAEAIIQNIADHGITVVLISQNPDGWIGYPDMFGPEFAKLVDSVHAKGMKAIMYIESNVYYEQYMRLFNFVTNDSEMQEIDDRHRDSELIRKVILSHLNEAIEKHGIDGVYYDSLLALSATDGVSNVEGCVELVRDTRMLLDYYSPDKILGTHSWHHIIPNHGISDMIFPGEQMMDTDQPTLSPDSTQYPNSQADAMYEINYNSYLAGVQIIALSQGLSGTYDATAAAIQNQFIRSSIQPGCNNANETWDKHGVWDNWLEWGQFNPYIAPVAEFDISDTVFANTAYIAYSLFFAPTIYNAITKDSGLDVGVYKKDSGTILATITRAGDCETAGSGSVTLRLDDMGITATQVDVTNKIVSGTTRETLVSGDLTFTVADGDLPAEYVIVPVE